MAIGNGGWDGGDYDYFGGAAQAPPGGSPPPAPAAPTTSGFGAPATAPGTQNPSGFAPSSFGTPSSGGFSRPPDPPGGGGQRRGVAMPRLSLTKIIGVVVLLALVVGVVKFGSAYSATKKALDATTVTMPDSIAGRAAFNQDKAEDLRADLTSDLGGSFSNAQVGVFGTPGASAVLVIAAEYPSTFNSMWENAPHRSPVDAFVAGVESDKDGTKVAGMADIAPGRLGGKLACGAVKSSGDDVGSVCLAYDKAAVVAMFFLGSTPTDADAVAVREAVERRRGVSAPAA